MTDRILRALVTGASTGIGAAFARELAARGVEPVLVARDGARLEALQRSLAVRSEVLVADLTVPGDRQRVVERLTRDQGAIDLLVNNAGIGVYGPVATQEPTAQAAMLELNVVALTALARALLPSLVARGHGGIINVGSIAGAQPGPGGAVYGATKAYVASFTRAVQAEVADHGVQVMLLAPGITATEFHDRAGVSRDRLPSPSVMTADAVVAAALDDYARGREVSAPGLANRLALAGARAAPVSLSRTIAARVHDRMQP
ncbi:MAG: SDR family NAD(P)-dependent oxidoreductase [Nitriliruptoraceae bacterium]|nr:SDR family NAD(P)-dependent oxidoreductase [Nitriliruptoraceae bacterium]